jgi:hypothetical protein
MLMQPRRLAQWALVIVVVLVALLTTWPTPWRFEHACTRLVRINRFTGAADLLMDDGWSRLRKNPIDEMVREQESERLGYVVTSTLVCPSYK